MRVIQRLLLAAVAVAMATPGARAADPMPAEVISQPSSQADQSPEPPVESKKPPKPPGMLIRSDTINLVGWAAMLFDYTWVSQDQANIRQVGVQEDQFEWRADRLILMGTLFNKKARPWSFQAGFEIRGLDGHEDNNWSFYDYWVSIPVGPLGDLQVGKGKEPFSYELVGDSAALTSVERILGPFLASPTTGRSTGFRLNKMFPGGRSTMSLGAFNNWYETEGLAFGDSGWDYNARLTALPVWGLDGHRYLHVGAAWRHAGAKDGTLRYKGRPESHVIDYFVDTGDIPASHADSWAAELLWNERAVSVTAEYITSHVSSVEANNPIFDGWYVAAAWAVTGENRPYDKRVGYAHRIVPKRRWGAVELMARYAVVDTTDQAIDGGNMIKWFAGVNWYPSGRWRVNLGYGEGTLDKGGVKGRLHQTLARLQYIFPGAHK